MATVSELKAQQTSNTAQKAQLEAKNTTISATITGFQTTITTLQGSLTVANNTLASAQSSLSGISKTITKVDEEGNEVEITNPEYTAASQAVAAAQTQVDAVQSQLTAIQTSLTNAQNEQQMTEQEIVAVQAEIQALQAQVQQAVSEADEAKKTVDNTTKTQGTTTQQDQAQAQGAKSKTDEDKKEDYKSWLKDNASKFSDDDDSEGSTLCGKAAMQQAGATAAGAEASNLDGIVDGSYTGATYTCDVDNDGEMEDVTLKEWMETTQDCELDLYANEMMVEFFETFGTAVYNSSGGYGALFKSEEAQAWLKAHNVSVTMLDNRNFVFNVVDEDGNVIQNDDGQTGEAMFFDGLIADGYAQEAEQKIAEILDTMGLDILSKADFNGTEAEWDELMSGIASDIENGEYESTNKVVADIYANAKTLTAGYSLHNSHSSETSSELLKTLEDDKNNKDNDKLKKMIDRASELIEDGYSNADAKIELKKEFKGDYTAEISDKVDDMYKAHKESTEDVSNATVVTNTEIKASEEQVVAEVEEEVKEELIEEEVA